MVMKLELRITLKLIRMRRYSRSEHISKPSSIKAATPKDSVTRPRALLENANGSSEKTAQKSNTLMTKHLIRK